MCRVLTVKFDTNPRVCQSFRSRVDEVVVVDQVLQGEVVGGEAVVVHLLVRRHLILVHLPVLRQQVEKHLSLRPRLPRPAPLQITSKLRANNLGHLVLGQQSGPTVYRSFILCGNMQCALFNDCLSAKKLSTLSTKCAYAFYCSLYATTKNDGSQREWKGAPAVEYFLLALLQTHKVTHPRLIFVYIRELSRSNSMQPMTLPAVRTR